MSEIDMTWAPATPRLERFMPSYDFNEVHDTVVNASAAETYAALLALRARDVPVMGVLMAARSLPARLTRRVRRQREADSPILERLGRHGFLMLEEEPGRELVFGIVGQFWKLVPEPVRLDRPSEFVGFSRPGFARAVMNFEIVPSGDSSCHVRTETRVQATDADARRAFARYWRVVHPWSALIRRAWLRALRARAEAKRRERRA